MRMRLVCTACIHAHMRACMHTFMCASMDGLMDVVNFCLSFEQMESGSKAVAAKLVTKYAKHKASPATRTDKVS